MIWNFSQPIADNMEEAVSGVKGELAIKVYGDDLKALEETGDQILGVMRRIRGVQDLGSLGHRSTQVINLQVDREQAARYQISEPMCRMPSPDCRGRQRRQPSPPGRAAVSS